MRDLRRTVRTGSRGIWHHGRADPPEAATEVTVSTPPHAPVTCPVCAVQADPGTQFCGWCGAPIPAAHATATGAVPPAAAYAPTDGAVAPVVPSSPAPAGQVAPSAPVVPVAPPIVTAAPPGPVPVAPPTKPAPGAGPGLAPPPPPSPTTPQPAPAPRTAPPSPSAGGSVAVTPGDVAPVSRRLLAYLVDGALIGVVYGLGTVVALATVDATGRPSPLAFLPPVLAVLIGIGQWVAESTTGATVGGALLGIRTVSARTGLPAGLLAVLLRNLVVAAGSLACGIGQVVVVLSGLWDREPAQRGWHDKAAGTLVLRAAAARRPRPAAAGTGAWDSAVARAVEPRAVGPMPSSAPPSAAVPPGPVVPPVTSVPGASSPGTAPEAHRAGGAHAAAAPSTEAVDVVRPAPVDASALAGPAAAPHPAEDPLIDAVPGLAPQGAPAGAPASSGPLIDSIPVATAPVPTAAVRRERTEAPIDTTAVPLVELPPRRDRPSSAPATGFPSTAPAAPDAAAGGAAGTSGADAPAPPATGEGAAGRPNPVMPPPAPLAPAGAGSFEGSRPAAGPAGDAAATGLGDLEHTRLRDAGPIPRAAALRLVLDTGERVDVTGDGLVGRSPAPEPGVEHVVAVADRSVSKVHLAFGVDPAGGLWVMDRGSTNGTFLVGPDGSGTALTPGTRGVVEAGWTVRFGERSARVERA